MKTAQYLTIFFIVVLSLFSCEKKEKEINYQLKELPSNFYQMKYEAGNWEHPKYKTPFVSRGNHRVVLMIENQGVTQVKIPWRRRDTQPENKEVLVVDARTEKVVENSHLLEINNEYGHIVFETNEGSNKYYVYYLPHSSTGSYYPKLSYNEPSKSTNSWFSALNLTSQEIDQLPAATIISAQSIDDFHSFFPMEVVASEAEVAAFKDKYPQPFYLIPEYRDRSIKMNDFLPVHWVKNNKKANGLKDKVSRGEHYTLQIGVFSFDHDLSDLTINYGELKGRSGSISKITCYNTEGTDLNGNEFQKQVNVSKGKVQSLWFGVDIPSETSSGSYTGQFIVQPVGFQPDTIFLTLEVGADQVANHGDDEPENMTRLRWLNSTIGTNEDDIIKPFTPVEIDRRNLSILGREVTLNAYGFPGKIGSFFTQEMTKMSPTKEEILNDEIHLKVIDASGQEIQWQTGKYEIQQAYESSAEWETTNTHDDLLMEVGGTFEYDGMLAYKIKLIALHDINIQDVKLSIPMENGAAKYMLGLGCKGGALKEDIKWKWDVTRHHEGAWIGGVNKGLQFVLRDENYERPLNTNFYQAKPLNLPPSWYNDGKGGINIERKEDRTLVTNYSGSRSIKKGDTLNFNVRFLITPFKLINTKDHFTTRFVHKYVPVDTAKAYNGTIINVHHANEINPYINYPFFALDKQKAYIDEAHAKGLKVKLYNTIRELTYKSHELFALRSLGDEILNDGEGGGHSWLQEHLKTNYHAAWHATSVNDAAILNKGTSRWTNYYIEGINWLAKNQEIDGLYLDDIAFSRSTVKRIASVFNTHRDNFVIDLHSANQYNNRDGFINSALLYMEHFPYITRLWFGEYFEYDLDPDYWMTEVSGIPFGLTGEMLEKGGHPYRGLVYGMTTRVYGKYNPGPIWKLFEEEDIADSEMLGYWVDRSPIKTNTPGIKSTVYLGDGKAVVAIGSWSKKDERVTLEIDWQKLKLDSTKVSLSSPAIDGLQEEKTWNPRGPVIVPANQGLILVLKESGK